MRVKLTDKYRPRIFEDLLGQEAAARWLGAQVRARSGKSVILCGGAGLGKTSAARIYAQGHQCENLSETGSPCLACEECRGFLQPGGHPNHIKHDCARFGRLEDVQEALRALRSNPIFGSRWILELNEAQGASPRAHDAVLTLLEEPPSWAVFIIVTPEIDKLPPTIKSRCAILEFQPISFEASLSYMTRLCHLEKIQYEAEGLALIAEVSRGEVREMVTRLDQVSEGGGGVTEQEVRRLFNLDYVDTVVEYIRAVLASDLQLQLVVVDRWRDRPSKKAEAIEAVLTFLFTTGVLRLRREGRIINAMLPADQEWIVAEMSARAAAADIDERKFWQEIVDFWRPGGSEFTDATLVAKVVKFDALLNIDRGLGSPARAVRG
jgi:DNA polymerase-3 subunit gamma/tau